MAQRRSIAPTSVVALLLCGSWWYVLQSQFPLSMDVQCWFFDPHRQELSPSEVLSAAAWLLAALLASAMARTDGRWGLAAVACAGMLLEETNYGVPLLTALAGEYRTGYSFHNIIEATDQDTYWLIEVLAKDVMLASAYFAVPVLTAWRKRSLREAAPYAVPALLFTMTTLREFAWESRFGHRAFMNHPCIDLADELYETLSSIAVLWWLVLRAPGVFSRQDDGNARCEG